MLPKLRNRKYDGHGQFSVVWHMHSNDKWLVIENISAACGPKFSVVSAWLSTEKHVYSKENQILQIR